MELSCNFAESLGGKANLDKGKVKLLTILRGYKRVSKIFPRGALNFTRIYVKISIFFKVHKRIYKNLDRRLPLPPASAGELVNVCPF